MNTQGSTTGKILSADCNYALSRDLNGSIIIRLVNDSDSSQIWEISYVGWNISIGVPGRDLFLNYTSPQNAVNLGQYDSTLSMWNPSYTTWLSNAIRPISITTQNLNAFGGLSDGATVGTYPWNGGQPNEVWFIKPCIAAIRLENVAPITCRINFTDYTQNQKHLSGSGDINLNKTGNAHPTDTGANNGDIVALRMAVTFVGNDFFALERFIVDSNSKWAAYYITDKAPAPSTKAVFKGIVFI